MRPLPGSSLVIGLTLLGAIWLASSSFYTITSGTVGVLATFGKFNEDVQEPGLHFKVPVMQTIRIFDIKLQTVTYQGKNDRPDTGGVINKPHIQVLDNKNLPIGVEMSIQFTPVADEATLILKKYGYGYYDKLINPQIRDIIRNVVGKYHAEEIADKRSDISFEIRNQLAKRLQGQPFILNEVSMRNIKLPPIVLKKIEEVQIAKQEEQRLAMVEKQASKEQHIKTIQANTKLIEVTTHAKAEAEKKRIGADAKAYQITKEAEAIADANRRIAASITSELINYKSIEQWNGRYPQTLLGSDGSGGLILSLPPLPKPPAN